MEILRDVLTVIGAGTVICALFLVAWSVMSPETDTEADGCHDVYGQCEKHPWPDDERTILDYELEARTLDRIERIREGDFG